MDNQHQHSLQAHLQTKCLLTRDDQAQRPLLSRLVVQVSSVYLCLQQMLSLDCQHLSAVNAPVHDTTPTP